MDLSTPDLVWPIAGYKSLRTIPGEHLFFANGYYLEPGANKAHCKFCEHPELRARKRKTWEPYLKGKDDDMPRFYIPPADGGIPPVQDHMCGLHQWHALEDAVNYQVTGFLGTAIAWGRVLFDEKHLRAEYQQLVALCEIADPGYGWPNHKTFRGRQYTWKCNTLKKAAEHYGVPILAPEELEAYVLSYGVPYAI